MYMLSCASCCLQKADCTCWLFHAVESERVEVKGERSAAAACSCAPLGKRRRSKGPGIPGSPAPCRPPRPISGLQTVTWPGPLIAPRLITYDVTAPCFIFFPLSPNFSFFLKYYQVGDSTYSILSIGITSASAFTPPPLLPSTTPVAPICEYLGVFLPFLFTPLVKKAMKSDHFGPLKYLEPALNFQRTWANYSLFQADCHQGTGPRLQ